MIPSKINSHFEVYDKPNISQGDIFNNLRFSIFENEEEVQDIVLPYAVLVSQACDIDSAWRSKSNPKFHAKENGEQIEQNNQYLPNVLILPAFNNQHVKEGMHLESIFNVKQENIDKTRWNFIKKNKNERYHYIHSILEAPDLIIDFKIYFSINFNYILKSYEAGYMATLSELFRESLSQRFANYLCRIGLPDLSVKEESSL